MQIVRDQARDGRAAQVEAGFSAFLLSLWQMARSHMAWFPAAWRERLARLREARAERRMELVEVLQLGGKRQLMLVACHGRQYLVGVGGDSVQSIVEIGDGKSTEDRLRRAEPTPQRTGMHWNGIYLAAQPPEPGLGPRH